MTDQTSSLEEQEELLDRLTWTDSDHVLEIIDHAYNPTIGLDAIEAWPVERIECKFAGYDAETIKAMIAQRGVKGSSSYRVLRPFLSSDRILFRPDREN